MALQAPGKQTQKQTIRGFTGVNLRVPADLLDPMQLVEGVNVDLSSTPGIIRARKGITGTPGVTTTTDPIRAIFAEDDGRIVGVSWASAQVVGGGQYADVAAIGVNYRPRFYQLIVYQSLTAPTKEYFLANINMARLNDGGADWGIAPPTSPPSLSVSGTGITGDYSVVYTYVRKQAGSIVHESNPSPAATITASNEQIDVDVDAPSDPQVTHLRFYRTVASGTVHLFEVERPASAPDPTLSVADGALGAAVEEDNDQPPLATLAHVLSDRVWTNNIGRDGRLHYSKRFLPEAFPSANFIDMGTRTEKITAITSIDNVLIVFTEYRKFRVIEVDSNITAVGGNLPVLGGSSTAFVAFELPGARGTRSPGSVISTGIGLIYASHDGIYVLRDSGGSEQKLSDKIQPLFNNMGTAALPPIDKDYEDTMAAVFYKDRYYLSYRSTKGDATYSDEGISVFNDYTIVIDMASQESYFWDVGFDAFFVEIGEGRLYGSSEGDVYILEERLPGSNITVTARTASIPIVDGSQAGLLQWMRIDADIHMNDTLTAALYVDDALAHTATITGARTRQLIKLPSGVRGKTWNILWTYTGKNPLEIRGAEIQYKILASS